MLPSADVVVASVNGHLSFARFLFQFIIFAGDGGARVSRFIASVGSWERESKDEHQIAYFFILFSREIDDCVSDARGRPKYAQHTTRSTWIRI